MQALMSLEYPDICARTKGVRPAFEHILMCMHATASFHLSLYYLLLMCLDPDGF